MLNQKVRQSNFELLRILALLGIIIMHVNGPFLGVGGGYRIFSVLENTLFNSGVSIFILISGYFGLRGNREKIIRFEVNLILYSLISFVIGVIATGSFSVLECVKSFMPVITQKHWFMTVYMLLLIFSPFTNIAIERLSKKEFQKLIIALFVVFSVLPTLLYYHPMGDRGKGLMNLFLIYLIGVYIRKYFDTKLNIGKLIVGGTLIYLITVLLNLLVSVVLSEGASTPFARDCSSLIIIQSVIIFLIFREINLSSKVINFISKQVFCITMIEGSIRMFISNRVFSVENVYNQNLPICVITIAAIVLLVGLIIGIFLDCILGKIKEVLIKALNTIAIYIVNKCSTYKYYIRKIIIYWLH
ncbi:hypothetical protein GCM10008910_22810 [Faecalicatena orotica]|uniref:Surface polysaccharide O-acyltransferase-like enzyme n=1 Tax=Faecalicatena orotica TaxID=1544 RepID=A0A2Y9BKF7_9FIRM|nr:acyltransferase [Faecalicatena orotica]PWJ20737.1 surface polysaccharide O-acyltransferase-like enzyme [Faecalicatena orotica]SSA58536.1 Surface polysaccharide O-acyltransferase, integral membrane enzyme [Faecalicatena orotica]